MSSGALSRLLATPGVPLGRSVSDAIAPSGIEAVAGSLDVAEVPVGPVAQSQVEQCYLNIATALAEAGGTFDDVAKLTVHVVDWTPDKMPLLLEGIRRASAKLGVTPVPPAMLLGVAALDIPDHLVEIEATAVLG